MKKNIIRFIAILLSFLMTISLLPTTGMTVEAAARPKLTKDSGSIVVGGTTKIKVKNAPKRAKITYKSERKGIAAVSKQGAVKGIKNGSTKITVTIKNRSKATKLIYKITVKNPKLSKSKLSLKTGETAKLSVKDKPVKAKYSWTSSDSQIAAVSKNGTVRARAKGNATIKVKIKTVKKTYTLQCKVAVKTANSNTDIEPTGIMLDRSSASIEEGGTITFTATVMPDNATNRTVIWSSSNTNVATVSSGTVTGISAGSATITAKTINNKICTCEVKVSPKSSPALDFDKFAQEGAELIKKSGEPSGTIIAEEGEFASKRLIVRGKNTQLDFTQFAPKAVVKSDDGIYLIQFASVSAAKTALSEISNWPDVEWAEPDTYSDVDTADDVSTTSRSWGVPKIGADKYADSISSIRDDIVVAVVDSGVSNHTFLSGRIQNGGYDYVDNDSDPSDKHYHGTHVAGTIVDCTPGLNVKVLPVRVLNAEGKGSSFNVGNGIKYAADHGAKVINLSLGGTHSIYKDENIEYAINKGVIVVVAAGNDNRDTEYHCPAHLKEAIVVAAVDENDRKASFSNFGDSVDVAAPGVGIISCVPGGSYQSLNGTSMAAPHVSAVAAMFKLKQPSMTPAQVETMIKENVRDLGSSGWDRYYGSGILDLTNIVEVQPTGVTLDQSNISLKAGGIVTLTATVVPGNATNKKVEWKSSAPTVAEVDGSGKVTAKAAGEADITVTTVNGKTAVCHVTVEERVIEAESVTLDKAEEWLEEGKSITLKATVQPENTTDKKVEWKSSAPAVAEVDGSGKVTAKAPGEADITVTTVNGKTAVCHVTVEPKPVEVESISIESIGYPAYVGSTFDLTAVITPDNAMDKTVTWEIDDPSVAKVEAMDDSKADGAGGVKVTPLQDGKKAVITATAANGRKAAFKFVSLCPPIPESDLEDRPIDGYGPGGILGEPFVPVEQITLDKENENMEIGDHITITATIAPENSSLKSIRWRSSEPDVVGVDNNGVVTAKAPGEAVITATVLGFSPSDDKKAECRVTVEPVVRGAEGQLSIVSKGYPTYVLGSFYLIAIAPDTAEHDALTWESSDSDIVKIEREDPQDGQYGQVKVTLMYVGKATITVKTATGKTEVFEVDSKLPSTLTPPIQTVIPPNPGDFGDD